MFQSGLRDPKWIQNAAKVWPRKIKRDRKAEGKAKAKAKKGEAEFLYIDIHIQFAISNMERYR